MSFTIDQGVQFGNGVIITYQYPTPPFNIDIPTFSPISPIARDTLICSTGNWNPGVPQPILNYDYQWQLNGSNISNANSNTYTVTSNDIGGTLRCLVIATNPSLNGSVFTTNSSIVGANVPAAPGNVIATSKPFGNVEITFSTPDNGGSNILIYNANSNVGNNVGYSNASPINVSNLVFGNTYTFDVVGVSNVGIGYPGTSNAVTIGLSLNLASNVTTGANSNTNIITMSFNEQVIYAASTTNTGIRRFLRNVGTGSINTFATTSTGTAVGDVVVSSDDLYVYATHDGGITQYSQNTSTGVLTVLNSTTLNFNFGTLALSPNNNFIYSFGTNASLVNQIRVIDTSTLLTTQIVTITGLSQNTCEGMTVSKDFKNLYIAVRNSPGTDNRIYIYDINSTNGQLTYQTYIPLGGFPTSAIIQDIILSNDDKNLYAGFTDDYVRQYTRNTSNGSLTGGSIVYSNTGVATTTLLMPYEGLLMTPGGSFARNTINGNLTYANSVSTYGVNPNDSIVTILTNPNLYTIGFGSFIQWYNIS